MKKYLTILFACGLCVMANTVSAANTTGRSCPPLCALDCITPFVGVDYKSWTVAGRRDWESHFPRNYEGVGAYVGFKFHENLGVEAGYEQTFRKTKVLGSYTFFGVNLAGFQYTRSIRFDVYHLDLNYYLPVLNCLDFFASIGVESVSFTTRQSQISPVDDPALAPQAREFIDLKLRQKVLARFRAGMQYYMTENIGARALVGFENFSHIMTTTSFPAFNNPTPNLNIRRSPLKDAVTFCVGVFWMFD